MRFTQQPNLRPKPRLRLRLGAGWTVGRCARLASGVGSLFMALTTLSAMADPGSEPLWVENLSPVAGILGVPSLHSARITPGWQVDTNMAIASHFVAVSGDGEVLLLDGETSRLTAAMTFSWSDDWSVRLSVPWVAQDSGFLDSLINGWHDFFGMSDGGRSAWPEDQLAYRYRAADHGFELVDPGSGVGDVSLELNHALYQTPQQALTLGLGYKFPTGDEDAFLGSGAADIFAVLRFSGDHLADLPLTWHGQVGILDAGDSPLLGPRQETPLWFAGFGVDWRVAEAWSLLAQYDAHAGVMASQLDALGARNAGMLSLGARWYPSSEWSIDLSFIEDVAVTTAPDVTFQATLRWRPRR